MNKNYIRKVAMNRRLNFSINEINNYSKIIKLKLFNKFDFNKFNFVHIFLPIIEKGEINTWLIINRIFSKFPNIKIVVPKVNNDILEHYIYTRNTPLIRSKFGVLEPMSKYQFNNIFKLDIIIIPLLGFDINGNRVGYGCGYYDNFLVKCHGATKIGFSFEEPINKIIDIHENDIKLDFCITPNNIFKF